MWYSLDNKHWEPKNLGQLGITRMTEVFSSYNMVEHLLNGMAQQAVGDMARATSSLSPPSHQ